MAAAPDQRAVHPARRPARGTDRAPGRRFGASLAGFHDQTRALADGSPPSRVCSNGSNSSVRRANTTSAQAARRLRQEELARSHECFFGPDGSYHEARRRFVYKSAPAASEHPGTTRGLRSNRARHAHRLRHAGTARIVLPGTRPANPSVDIAAADLRAATRYYEQHVSHGMRSAGSPKFGPRAKPSRLRADAGCLPRRATVNLCTTSRPLTPHAAPQRLAVRHSSAKGTSMTHRSTSLTSR